MRRADASTARGGGRGSGWAEGLVARGVPLLLSLAVCFGPMLRAQDTAAVRTSAGGVLVDFQDADIRLVITALAEAARLNVSYGELPARRLTLRMRQPVAVADILPLLRSIAESNGLRLTVEAGLVRVEAIATGEIGGRGGAVSPADTSASLRLFVYRLRHARASQLASTLRALFGDGGAGRPSTGARRAPLSERLREQRIPLFNPDTLVRPAPTAPSSTGGATGVAPGIIAGQLQGDVQIVPEEFTNSLLVRALAEDWLVIQQAIQSVDLRPLQVAIEVLIAEVRLTSDVEVGVTGKVTNKPRTGSTVATGAELKGASAGDFVLEYMRSGRIDVTAALSLLASRGNVRIVSRPLLIAQNGEEAKILVGAERPFIQVFRSLPTDAAVRDQVVQYRDVGTSLNIRPIINPDGYVNLDVVQQVSTATTETQFGAPVISTREASTHLFVRSGQSALIGGLIDRQLDRTRSGIPLLMDVPGIGRLFGTTRSTTINSELFIFLTPHVVDSDAELERIQRELEQHSKYLDGAVRRSPSWIKPAVRADSTPPRMR